MLKLQTPVDITPSAWRVDPFARVLLVGSCFTTGIGERMVADRFRAVVNPHGVMYNPASVVDSVKRYLASCADVPQYAFLTFGTNHVYRLKSTGEIVDNCHKQPAALFDEEELDVEQCVMWIVRAVELLRRAYHSIRVVLTVSPIRYAKYGFHGSQLSKAALLLAVEKVCHAVGDVVSYFPAYEIVNDELRDYRFYAPDMLHPSPQAVDYIYSRVQQTYYSDDTLRFLADWHPVRAALAHRPLNPDSAEHQDFVRQTEQKMLDLFKRYPDMPR